MGRVKTLLPDPDPADTFAPCEPTFDDDDDVADERVDDDDANNGCDVCRDAGCRHCLPDAKGWVF